MEENMPQTSSHVTLRIHKALLFLIFLIFAGLIAGFAYFAGKASVPTDPKNPPQVPIQPTPTVWQWPNITKVPTPTEIHKEYPQNPPGIPTSVEKKYQEIKPTYEASSGYKGLGAGIKYCKKGSQEIFSVWGSGGYTGENHYYTKNGKFLGSTFSSDTPLFNTGDSEIKIIEYGCIDVKVSSAPEQPIVN